MAIRERKCPECFDRGITVTFRTGNELKKHRQQRHPKTDSQKSTERRTLRAFRTEAILALRKD